MSSTIEQSGSATPRLPGETGVWMFIIGDVIIFTLLFSVFVHDRSQEVALFAEQQLSLNQTFGAINTLVLLTSSWFVAMALHGARNNEKRFAGRGFAFAALCGFAFIGVKYFEWGEKIRAGLTIETNNFFMYYYLMTGIHLLHVIIGIGVLFFLWHTVRSGEMNKSGLTVLESGACFWHLVDILWIALFALLYLMR